MNASSQAYPIEHHIGYRPKEKMSNCHLTSIDLNDPSQFTELTHQRRLCGWDYDPVTLATWQQRQLEGSKLLFWIVTSSTSSSSSSSNTPTPTDADTTPNTKATTLCGHISLEPTPTTTPNTFSIKALFIHPSHRRGGTGRQAMQLVEKEASARGAQRLELTALSKRYVYDDGPQWRGIWETKFGIAPPAFSVQEWYEGMGFEVWKEEAVTEERAVDGEVVLLWEAFMRKEL